MNDITPSKLSELFKEKKISKSEFLQRIITFYEFSSSEEIRMECLNAVKSVNITNEKMFNFLEEIVISESNTKFRLYAMNLILNKFPDKGYNLANYLVKSNESQEFIIELLRYIGENLINSDENLKNQFLKLLHDIVLEIFKNEDVKRFEALWGDWFYQIPPNYWNFLLNLNSPVGYLEIFDYFINDEEIYRWFYNNLFKKFSLDQWIKFIKNSSFSGRLLYILFYLEEEIPPDRFYQIIELPQYFEKDFTKLQQKEMIYLLKKKNRNDLALILIFQWLNNLNRDILKKILEDPNLNLLDKLNELVFNKQFDFFKHNYLIYSLISLLVKIYKNVNEKYFIMFFNINRPVIFEKLMPVLNTFLQNSRNVKSSKIEKKYFLKFKVATLELLKILSEYIDLRLMNS